MILQLVFLISSASSLSLAAAYRGTHQVGEVISVLAGHQPAGVAEARDVLDVGLQARRVGLQHDVDERRQEVVGRRRLVLGDPNGAEDVFAAACDAAQFVSGNPLRVHLDDIWNKQGYFITTTAEMDDF